MTSGKLAQHTTTSTKCIGPISAQIEGFAEPLEVVAIAIMRCCTFWKVVAAAVAAAGSTCENISK